VTHLCSIHRGGVKSVSLFAKPKIEMRKLSSVGSIPEAFVNVRKAHPVFIPTHLPPPHTIATIHLLHLHTTTMVPSATVHPETSGHFSITMLPINTKFEERIEYESINRLE
jgi:hypothetical protein